MTKYGDVELDVETFKEMTGKIQFFFFFEFSARQKSSDKKHTPFFLFFSLPEFIPKNDELSMLEFLTLA